jgi:hypothetical protein
MKIRGGFKIWLYGTSLSLYLSGLLIWILEHWFYIDRGFGSEPRPLRADVLHLHGILGLLFLIIFGCLYETHIKRGLRAKRRLKSGLFLLLPLLVLLLTVQGLYYLNDGDLKTVTIWTHTYFGLALFVPGLLHPFFSKKI